MRAVLITDEAQYDLSDIADYLRREAPFRADEILERLERACFELSNAAEHYQLFPGREHRGVRRRVFKPYNILYRVNGDSVEIVHVLHSARDVDRLLFPED